MNSMFRPDPPSRFETGEIVFPTHPEFWEDESLVNYALWALNKHLQRKWGFVDEETARSNDHALLHGGRLVSRYGRFEIVTAADRSVTTIVLRGLD
jgi:hypothetical protein